MNISYINLFLPAESVLYDYFWLSVKSYVEDNFQGDTEFNWSYPLTDSNFKSTEDMVDLICGQEPDILMLSLYVWNHALTHQVAKEVKARRPNTIIVAGGPHQEYNNIEFWLSKPYIDFCCETDGYGEVFFNEFLYQLTNEKDWSQVPYLIYKGGRSFAKYNKRDFVYPPNVYERNKDYIQTRVDLAKKHDINILLMYETSRGCPYGCTYCEWGGGTSSKLSWKPIDVIKDDLEFLIEFTEPQVIGLTDANFGIVDRDIEIAQHIADMKNKYGYPKGAYMYGPTKKNKKNLYAIEEIFASNGMTEEYKISVQDLDDQVIKNIKRTDTPWYEQNKEYVKLRDKYGGRIRLELMMGLPGTTIKYYYDALDAMCPEGSFGSRYVWHLLPTTPAAKPEYREKYSIETIKLKNVWRPEFGSNYANNSLLLKDEYVEPTNIVVATNSYTKEEWCEMFIMDRIITSMEVEGFTTYIAKYVSEVLGIPHSKFYNRMWNTFINNNDYLPKHQQDVYAKVIKEVNERVSEGYAEDIEHYKLPDHYPFDYYASIIRLNKIVVHTDRNAFYRGILRWAVNEFGDDEGLKDIIKWTANSIMFIDHDPDNPNEYVSDYDWFSWINGGELVKQKCINIPRDRTRSNNKFDGVDIDWHNVPMKERVQKYFLLLCSEPERYLIFKDIEVKHDN